MAAGYENKVVLYERFSLNASYVINYCESSYLGNAITSDIDGFYAIRSLADGAQDLIRSDRIKKTYNHTGKLWKLLYVK